MMIGIGRRLALLGVILCFALLLTSALAEPQQENKWEGAIASLAAKIAASAGPHAVVRVSVKNISTLDASRVADFAAALEAQLRARGLRIEKNGSAGQLVEITIAENLRDVVFAAVSKRGETREVALETLAREKAVAASAARARVQLRREMIWSQREPMLDFLVWATPADSARRLIVLEPRRVVIYRESGGGWQAQESHPLLDLPPERDPLGGLIVAKGEPGAAIIVQMRGERCGALLDGAMQLNCSYDERPVIDLGAKSVEIGSVCGGGARALWSGDSDWTQTDKLSVGDMGGANKDPVGEDLAFSGPILALRRGVEDKTARVIWRDLDTGEYEAGIVTVDCGN